MQIKHKPHYRTYALIYNYFSIWVGDISMILLPGACYYGMGKYLHPDMTTGLIITRALNSMVV